jgi:hypothetical protein
MEQTQNAPATASSKWAEVALRFYLRWVGTVALLAVVAVVMPYAWMDAIHQALGMGKLPSEPVVGYLARSASAFYAMFGGLFWALSFRMHQKLEVLGFVGKAMLIFGVTLLVIDWQEGMPWFWIAIEGPMTVVLSVVLLVLRAQLKR